jgi:hypothetical protein
MATTSSGLLRLGANDVGQGYRPFQLPVYEQKHDGLALGLKWHDAIVGEIDVLVAQVAGADYFDVFALNSALGTLAGDAVEGFNGQLLVGSGGDGLGDGVGGIRIHGQFIQRHVFHAAIGHDVVFEDVHDEAPTEADWSVRPKN